MNYAVNIRMLFKYLIKCPIIRDIEIVKGRPFATDELNAVDNLFRRVVQIIGDDDFVSSLQ